MLIFILDGLKYGNAYIRGILPTMGLVDKDIQAKYIVASEFDPTSVTEKDVVVFVKYDRLSQSKIVKDTGARVVLDVVDSKKHWKQHRDYLDALIVNTKTQVEIIQKRDGFDKPIMKIPHIITNFSDDLKGQNRKNVPGKLSTLGYLGVPDTFTSMGLFETFCQQNGYAWRTEQPSIDTNEQATLALDLGCIHYTGDKERVGGTLSISKPSAKLINLFSYGIPALYTPYESYLDEVGASGYADLLWGCCNTPAAMFDKINILRDNMDFYSDLSNQAYDMSRKYHISNTKQIYKELIEYSSN
jgi:hypothetical protein